MPLKTKLILPGNSSLGIWHINEKEEELYNMLQLDEKEKKGLQAFNSSRRYLHWLGSRVLIRNLLNTDSFIELHQEQNGKPYIGNFPYQVSISHSLDRAAVMISKEYACGIDVEKIDPKIERIQSKFLTEIELGYILEMEHKEKIKWLTIAWSAKEALFKLYGKGAVSFKNHLRLHLEKSGDGIIPCEILKEDCMGQFDVNYQIDGLYTLAYVYGNCP